VIIIEFFFYVDHNSTVPGLKYNWFDMSAGFTNKVEFFPGFASIFFAFGTPVGALPVLKELNNNNQRRTKKVYNLSVLFLITFYLLVAVCGYFSVPMNTPSLIIDRNSIFSNDIAMSIGKILFMISLLFSYAVNYICAKISVVNIFFVNKEFTEFHNYIITIGSVIATTVIGCAYSKVNDYMNIMGGFIAVILTNILPTYMYVKTSKHDKYSWKTIVPVTMATVTVIIGWTAGIITIKNMF
jgi:amino acid permease